ncbi:hypothetical protein NIES298_47320, partial [Microcystis aeruginosa NIES-298]
TIGKEAETQIVRFGNHRPFTAVRMSSPASIRNLAVIA